MNKNDWQNTFGAPTEEFRSRVDETLMQLEEREMRKRTKLATGLVAAVLMTMLVMSVAIAATQIDLFRIFETADPIVPLEGAEELVTTNLAGAENEYFSANVEQAVYDGNGLLLKVRVAPVDAEKYVVIGEMTEGPNVGEDFICEDVTHTQEFTDEEGKTYTEEYVFSEIRGHKDGKEIIRCGSPRLDFNLGEDESASAEEREALGITEPFTATVHDELQPDGSLVYLIAVDALPQKEQLSVSLSLAGYTLDFKPVYGELKDMRFTLDRAASSRNVKLTPVDGAAAERFELLDAQIDFTDIRGYFMANYTYEPADDEPMGVTLRLYDAEGNAIACGTGWSMEDEASKGTYHCEQEMQSFETIPETFIVEVKVIDSDRILGRIECRAEVVGD